jgi:hypothetical protein
MARKILFFIFVFITIYCVFNFLFNPFGVERTRIAKIYVINKPYKIAVYSVEANATIEENIHVMRTDNDKVLKFYNGYDKMNGYYVKNDKLVLFLSHKNTSDPKTDTFTINLE